jgi:hypothetical protein
MQKAMQKFLLAVLFSFCLCSCEPFYYSTRVYDAVPIQTPLPSEKGELNAYGYMANQSAGCQASYAADSHLVIMGDVDFFNIVYPHGYPHSWDGPSFILDNKFSANIGAGYFNKINKNLRFDVLAGIGYSNSCSYTEIYTFRQPIELNDTNYSMFLQADIGARHKYFEYGAGLRFTAFTASGDLGLDSNGRTIPLVGSGYLAEPSIFVSAGLRNIKIKATLGYSALLSPPIANLPKYYFGGVVGSIGVAVRLVGKQ